MSAVGRAAAAMTLAAVALVGHVAPAPPVAAAAAASRDAAGAAATRGAAGVEVARMTIVEQSFDVAVPADVSITVRLPPPFDAASLGTDGSDTAEATLTVVAHGEIVDRLDVARIRAGEQTAPTSARGSQVEVPLLASLADPRIVRRAVDQLTVTVPVATTRTADALVLANAGVYPIRVELRVRDAVVGEATTFVHRRNALDAPYDDFPVALLMAQTAPPAVGDDGRASPSVAELQDVRRLVTALEGMDAVAAADPTAAETFPRGVQVQPATLQALDRVDPDLTARLIAVLARSEVLSAPELPLDVSAVVGLGREALYTEWLRTGENVISANVRGVRADRSLFLTDRPVSDAAVSYLAGTGVDAVVMGPDLYAATEGNIAGYGDPSWLQSIELRDGATVPVLRIDPHLAEVLAADPSDPAQAAIDLVAEVLAYRDYLDGLGRPVSRTGLLLARADGAVIDPELATAIARILPRVGGVQLVTPGDLVSSMDSQLIDGTLGTLTLPDSAGPEMASRFRTIDQVYFDSVGISSMLPDDDEHAAAWRAQIRAMPTTALSDADVERMAATVRTGFQEFRAGVHGPTPFAFTLTGRDGTIRFRLHNTTDVPLTVMVRLAGAKLTFPRNDQLYEIAPQDQTLVTVETESRSNGTSQVIVRILTPTGAQIVPDIVLTANVRAFSGLGPLITGGMLLMLLAWWLRHWQKGRKRIGALTTSARHPATRGRVGAPEPDPPVDGEECPATTIEQARALAPDGAGSSLPPS